MATLKKINQSILLEETKEANYYYLKCKTEIKNKSVKRLVDIADRELKGKVFYFTKPFCIAYKNGYVTISNAENIKRYGGEIVAELGTTEHLLLHCCDAVNMSVDEVLKQCRKYEVAIVRMCITWFLYEKTSLNTSDIAVLLNRDRSTITYHYQQVSGFLDLAGKLKTKDVEIVLKTTNSIIEFFNNLKQTEL